MMFDPTPEQVEAAAKAIWTTRYPDSRLDIAEETWAEVSGYGAWTPEALDILTEARAALVAAAGAAPQESKPGRTKYISPSFPGMIRNLWKSDPSENSVRTALKLAGDLIQELIDLKAAPVLPSSGVDEDALAEEIGRHKLVHVSVSRKSAFCACSPKVTAGVEDNRAWFEGHRARAVAEWFMGQER